jgi:hypothetical protein
MPTLSPDLHPVCYGTSQVYMQWDFGHRGAEKLEHRQPPSHSMPPIPVSNDIPTRVARLEKLETDLREFQIPRLRAVKSSVAEQQQCASELRQDIQEIEKELQVRLFTSDPEIFPMCS